MSLARKLHQEVRRSGGTKSQSDLRYGEGGGAREIRPSDRGLGL